MSELILRGFDLFLDKTHSAGKLSISPEITETVFLVLGFLLVFAGAKLYRLVISLVMFIGVTLLFCTLLDGRAGWGTIVTAFTILGCLLGFMAFSWKTADSILFAGMTAAAAAWISLRELPHMNRSWKEQRRETSSCGGIRLKKVFWSAAVRTEVQEI